MRGMIRYFFLMVAMMYGYMWCVDNLQIACPICWVLYPFIIIGGMCWVKSLNKNKRII